MYLQCFFTLPFTLCLMLQRLPFPTCSLTGEVLAIDDDGEDAAGGDDDRGEDMQ